MLDEPQRARALGADEYLVKPVNRDALHAALDRVGISTTRLDGTRVFLLDCDSQDLDEVQGVLHQAGCMIRRDPEISIDLLADFRPEVGIVDLTREPVKGTRCLNAFSSLDTQPAVIALVGAAGETSGKWQLEIREVLAANGGIEAVDVVRAVQGAVAGREER